MSEQQKDNQIADQSLDDLIKKDKQRSGGFRNKDRQRKRNLGTRGGRRNRPQPKQGQPIQNNNARKFIRKSKYVQEALPRPPVNIQIRQRQSLPESQMRILRIFNLNPEITNQELYDLCVKYGAVESCRIDYDQRGMSKESATVKYRDHQSAMKAIDELNRAELDGRTISVEYKPFGSGGNFNNNFSNNNNSRRIVQQQAPLPIRRRGEMIKEELEEEEIEDFSIENRR